MKNPITEKISHLNRTISRQYRVPPHQVHEKLTRFSRNRINEMH